MVGCNRWKSLRVTTGCQRLPNLLITHEKIKRRRTCLRRSVGSALLNVRGVSQSASNASCRLLRYLETAAATSFHCLSRNPIWLKPGHRWGQKILRIFSVSCLFAIAGATMPPYSHAEQPLHRPPNFVFFLVDDLGWRDVGSFGSSFYETPNIDSLASQGVRFTNAYAASHVCSPTRASIMTGKYPARLRLTDWLSGRRSYPFERLRSPEFLQQLPLEEITIAEALKGHGYRTAHIGKWHLGEDPYGPLQQGFDVQVPRWNKGWPKAGYYAPFEFAGLPDEEGQYLTDRLTDVAETFISDKKTNHFSSTCLTLPFMIPFMAASI